MSVTAANPMMKHMDYTRSYDVSFLSFPILQIVNHQPLLKSPITVRQKVIFIAVFRLYRFYPISEVNRFQPLILLPIGVLILSMKINGLLYQVDF